MISRLSELFSCIRLLAAVVQECIPAWSVPALGSLNRRRDRLDENRPDGHRGEILRRFDSWLDKILLEEAPPAGLDAELLAELEEEGRGGADRASGLRDCPDLYTMWSAMCALTQEVKLQVRAFMRLDESMRATPTVAVAGGAMTEAQRQAQWASIELLLETRESLRRGLASARAVREASAHPDGRRLEDVVAALDKGYLMSIERLDDELERLDVRDIDCAGRPFDPNRMSAVDVDKRTDCPEGTVLDIYRAGYTWRGEIFRPAEVKVARPPRCGSREEM